MIMLYDKDKFRAAYQTMELETEQGRERYVFMANLIQNTR